MILVLRSEYLQIGRYMKSPVAASRSLNFARMRGVSMSRLPLPDRLSRISRMKALRLMTHAASGIRCLFLRIERYMRTVARFFLPVHRAMPWLLVLGNFPRPGFFQSLCGGVISLSLQYRTSDLNGLEDPPFFAVYFARSFAISRMILSSVANAPRSSN